MNSRTVIEQRPTAIDFFFDPQCPFAYQASLWIRDVSEQTGLRIAWRFFSLEEANHGENEPHPWERKWSPGWSLMRVGAHLRTGDPALLDTWYAAIGKAIHVDGRPAYDPGVAREIVAELGLQPDTVTAAMADPATNDAVRADHEWLVSTHGGFGVPTLVFPWGKALYGPVVAPAPTGDDAMRLWNLALEWVACPHLYEFKAPKSASEEHHLHEFLRPTFAARKEIAGR
ncbi:MAG: DsbA family protein [Chloroflexota bacterium]